MASPTKQTKIRRKLKKAALGTKRKNADRNHGTTAKNLTLDKPNAAEQKAKLSRAKRA